MLGQWKFENQIEYRFAKKAIYTNVQQELEERMESFLNFYLVIILAIKLIILRPFVFELLLNDYLTM